MSRVRPAATRTWVDDRGVSSIAAMIMLVIVMAGAGLVYDGGRALTARREVINVAEGAARAGAATVTADGLREDPARTAATQFLIAAGVQPSDIVAITITPTVVSVTLRASRDAVFGQLLGNETIVVLGNGQATATFGG